MKMLISSLNLFAAVSLLSLWFACSALAQDQVSVHIQTTNFTSPGISPNFASFSLEHSGTQGWMGNDTKTPKESFLNLMRQLMLTADQQGPILRIGGNSADTSWWNPDGQPRPANITYDIKVLDLIVLNNAAAALNSKLVVGLNFRRESDPSWAINHAIAIDKYLGWSNIGALEIGNECDLYGGNGIRERNFTFLDYQADWSEYAAAIQSAVPSAPRHLFQYATFARSTGSSSWVPDIPAAAKQHQGQIASVSLHEYPTTHCSGHNVTIAQILADSAVTGLSSYLSSVHIVDDLNSLEIPLVIGEGNSASCGGFPGVSNVFASALWAIDQLFHVAAIGIRNWNFHGGGSSDQSYTAIAYHSITTNQPIVLPLYYGLRAFSMATREGAFIVNSIITKSSNPMIKVWSTFNQERATAVIIHKDLAATESATISLEFDAPFSPFSFPTATVYRLLGRIDETYNITFMGQTYDGSPDGMPMGSIQSEKVQPQSPSVGIYTFKVPPLTVAILEWEVTTEKRAFE